MSLPAVLRREAEAEFEEAFDHYEGRRAGLGVDFAARVQKVFDRIANNPDMHAVVCADIRKAIVTRFPYCIYYRAETCRDVPSRGSCRFPYKPRSIDLASSSLSCLLLFHATPKV